MYCAAPAERTKERTSEHLILSRIADRHPLRRLRGGRAEAKTEAVLLDSLLDAGDGNHRTRCSISTTGL